MVPGSSLTSTERFILQNNPFRYRGYYYDTETGLYYLQSRYYDPNTGRFLNADGYVSTGTGLLGCNMYAFCDNNPVMYVDYTGMRILYNPQASKGTAKMAKFFANDDPDVVQNAEYFAFYKGVPVIKIDGFDDIFFDGDPQGAYYGFIFIDSRHADFDTVLNHEYGHYRQCSMLGLAGYTIFIAIPSLAGYWDDSLTHDEYFNQKQEITADLLGGVSRNTHTDEAKKDGWDYLMDAVLAMWGIKRIDRKERLHQIKRAAGLS